MTFFFFIIYNKFDFEKVKPGKPGDTKYTGLNQTFQNVSCVDASTDLNLN